MNFLKRDKDKDGRKGSKDRNPEDEPSPDRGEKQNGKENGKTSMTDKFTTFISDYSDKKRNKSKDGRESSKDRSHEKEPSPEKESEKDEIGDGRQKDKPSMTDKFTTFVSDYSDKKRNKNKDGRESSKDRSPEKDPSPEEDETDDGKKKEKSSMTDKVTTFMTPYLKDAQKWTAKGASDAKKDLQKYAGLGHRPDVVPHGEAFSNGEPRKVELGWHPVAGATGKWFAERTIIGKQITESIGKYPDPTQHWAVIVGDYVHQLWMDGNLDVIYINEKLKRDEWHVFEVGKTRFNDQALREASKMTIHNMREIRPAYNLISNNCQNFAVNLLKAIQVGSQREFGSTFAIYQRATGEGAIKDLFADKKKPGEEESTTPAIEDEEPEMGKPQRQDTVSLAQQVMEENTTKLDLDGDGRPG